MNTIMKSVEQNLKNKPMETKVCPCCHNTYSPKEKVKPTDIKFEYNGIIYTEKARRRDDAFFEVTTGRFAGCYVHIWNIIK